MYPVGCVTIPESVKCLEEDAFGWRERFQCVTIPNTVTTISAEAFEPLGAKSTS